MYRELLKEIEECRKEMISLSIQLPYTNKQVVEMSTKLDHLLNEFTNLSIKNK